MSDGWRTTNTNKTGPKRSFHKTIGTGKTASGISQQALKRGKAVWGVKPVFWGGGKRDPHL